MPVFRWTQRIPVVPYLPLALGLLATGTMPAQAQDAPLYARPVVVVEDLPANSNVLEFVPQGLRALTQNASWHTDFTFDRSMLALAGKLEGLDEPTRQAIARLNGVSVHSYRYPQPGIYDLAEVDSIRAQYDALGWKHVVSKKPRPGLAPGSTIPARTDLWIHLNGMNVAGVAVLLAEPSSLNLVTVAGDISTVDLLKLRGHFGIPKFDSDDIGR